ncbi:hypothetical protein SAMN04488084_101659 [Pedobacter antarcticus]|nr:hypothetical protein SAMN04488084_101659 [Pedobacter antarcticus]
MRYSLLRSKRGLEEQLLEIPWIPDHENRIINEIGSLKLNNGFGGQFGRKNGGYF